MDDKLRKSFHKVLLIALPLLLLAVTALGAVTFSRYINPKDQAGGGRVAHAVSKYEHKELTRISYKQDEGGQEFREKETIPVDNASDTLEIADIQPQDEIRYIFSISDTDGELRNELLLRVTVTIRVRLEMLKIDGGVTSVEKVYFGGGLQYSDGDVRSGAVLTLWHYRLSDGTTVAIAPPENGGSAVDYTGNSLYVSGSDESGYTNQTGFYMPPSKDAAKNEAAYLLVFRLPEQAMSTENYAGAKMYIDVTVASEQALSE